MKWSSLQKNEKFVHSLSKLDHFREMKKIIYNNEAA